MTRDNTLCRKSPYKLTMKRHKWPNRNLTIINEYSVNKEQFIYLTNTRKDDYTQKGSGRCILDDNWMLLYYYRLAKKKVIWFGDRHAAKIVVLCIIDGNINYNSLFRNHFGNIGRA